MKRILLLIASAIVSVGMSAQVVEVYKNGKLTATYANTADKTYKVVFDDINANILPGKFSVSATKQVQFTKSNIYWNGSDYHFEENATDYPSSWDESHVGHFLWTSLADYQSGTASYMPYNLNYNSGSQSESDKCWCGEDNKLTVDGISGLYALTGGSSGEWNYLLNTRTNASNLCKYNVTVTNGGTSCENCIVIAPDDYSNTLKSSYTLDELNADGLVCLPPAGYHTGSTFYMNGKNGYYWSATPHSAYSWSYANDIEFDYSYIGYGGFYRGNGLALRLVK